MSLRIDIPREPRRPRINLMPIMDVVFILVVFFLLAAQFVDEAGRSLALAPEGAGPQAEAAAPVPARLVVEKAGYRLDGVPLNSEELAGALTGLGERPLTVEAARDAPYQALVTALDAAGEAGIGQIRIVSPGSQGDDR